MLPQTGAILGMDVGFSATRATTGLCLLRWDAAEIGWQLTRTVTDAAARRRSIAALLGDGSVTVAAIDGPLRPGLDTTEAYRACECLLTRGCFQGRGSPGAAQGPSGGALLAHATALAAIVVERVAVARHRPSIHRRAVVEAFPNLFLGVLHDERRFPSAADVRRRWTDRLYEDGAIRRRLKDLVGALAPRRRIVGDWNVSDHDERAALVCALSGLAVASGRFVAVGSLRDGWITLPPAATWGRGDAGGAWAEAGLRWNIPRAQARFPGAAAWSDGRQWIAA
jgi:hypothetical protein